VSSDQQQFLVSPPISPQHSQQPDFDNFPKAFDPRSQVQGKSGGKQRNVHFSTSYEHFDDESCELSLSSKSPNNKPAQTFLEETVSYIRKRQATSALKPKRCL